MTDLVRRLRERHSFLCDEAAAELDRLNAQALELCAEISRLTRERDLADAALHSLQTRWANRATEQELRGLLARVVPYLDRGMEALHRDIAAALAGEPATEPAKTADQPTAAPRCTRCGDSGWLYEGDPMRGSYSEEPCGCTENWDEVTPSPTEAAPCGCHYIGKGADFHVPRCPYATTDQQPVIRDRDET